MRKLLVFVESLNAAERKVFGGALMVLIGLLLVAGTAFAGQSYANGQTLAGLCLGFGGIFLFVTGKDQLR